MSGACRPGERMMSRMQQLSNQPIGPINGADDDDDDDGGDDDDDVSRAGVTM